MKILNLVSQYFRHISTNKNRQYTHYEYIAEKIDGGQGGIISIDSQLHIINMCPKVYPLRRFLSDQMAVEMTRNTME